MFIVCAWWCNALAGNMAVVIFRQQCKTFDSSDSDLIFLLKSFIVLYVAVNCAKFEKGITLNKLSGE